MADNGGCGDRLVLDVVDGRLGLLDRFGGGRGLLLGTLALVLGLWEGYDQGDKAHDLQDRADLDDQGKGISHWDKDAQRKLVTAYPEKPPPSQRLGGVAGYDRTQEEAHEEAPAAVSRPY